MQTSLREMIGDPDGLTLVAGGALAAAAPSRCWSSCFYPYVYLLARAAFLEQSVCVLEVSRTLGCSPWSSFRRVALPLARPAIVAASRWR